MTWMGAGAIAIWNDITPEGRENFYDWHGREHIPERVGIPGFLDGRRYIAHYGAPAYFTLYLTRTPEVFRGADYAARLNAPTEWTLRSTADFRHVARALCTVEASVGDQVGGLMATWRYDPLEDEASGFRAALIEAVPDLAHRAGVAAVHFLAADMTSSRVDNAERKRRGDPNAVPPFILVVEGWDDVAPFTTLCQEITRTHFPVRDGLGAEHGLYQLQTLLAKPGPAAP